MYVRNQLATMYKSCEFEINGLDLLFNEIIISDYDDQDARESSHQWRGDCHYIDIEHQYSCMGWVEKTLCMVTHILL